eukprot:scaffold705_cov402-Prasinococcus_capsulatus_cf.AAC.8
MRVARGARRDTGCAPAAAFAPLLRGRHSRSDWRQDQVLMARVAAEAKAGPHCSRSHVRRRQRLSAVEAATAAAAFEGRAALGDRPHHLTSLHFAPHRTAPRRAALHRICLRVPANEAGAGAGRATAVAANQCMKWPSCRCTTLRTSTGNHHPPARSSGWRRWREQKPPRVLYGSPCCRQHAASKAS